MPDYRMKKVKPGTAIVWPTKEKPQRKLSKDQQRIKKIERKELKPTTARQWKQVIETLPAKLAKRLKDNHFWETGEKIVLSARTPIVEGHGRLIGTEIQVYSPETPALWFKYRAGTVDIWLENLDLDATYMVEIRLGLGNSSVIIGASDSDNYEIQAAGPELTLHVAISDFTYDISLITIDGRHADSLAFYEAYIWKIS